MKVMVIKIKHSVEEYLNKHCVRSVRIQSYSGLDFSLRILRMWEKRGPENIQIRTLFTQ